MHYAQITLELYLHKKNAYRLTSTEDRPHLLVVFLTIIE